MMLKNRMNFKSKVKSKNYDEVLKEITVNIKQSKGMRSK